MLDLMGFIIVFFTFILTLLLTGVIVKLMSSLGIMGIDIFKVDRPSIPQNGGLPLYIIYPISLYLLYLNGYIEYTLLICLLSIILITFIVGIIDDVYDPPGYYKPLAMSLSGIPIIFFGLYDPYLIFPLGVIFRITIIYPLLILIGISLAANTVNMLDVINGSALTGAIFTSLSILLSIYIIHGLDVNVLPLYVFIASLIALLIYNYYPARMFMGNASILLIGVLITFFSIYYKVEFPTVVAMLPFIHNSFFYLNKVKGFIEHKRLGSRVTYLDDYGYIRDARDMDAPLTLLRYIVSYKPLKEYDAYKNMVIVFLFSLMLSILSATLIGGWGS